MPQISSWTIANSGGSVYRAAVNTALAAIQSSSSGTAAPSPTVAGMLWYDTTNSILKRRNTANTAWVDVSSDTIAATTVRGNSSGSAAAEAAISMATLRTMLGFSQTLSAAGYITMPGGLIMQWGGATSGAGGAVAVTYPITFPAAVFGVMATVVSGGTVQGAWAAADIGTGSGTTLRAATASGVAGGSGIGFRFLVLGN